MIINSAIFVLRTYAIWDMNKAIAYSLSVALVGVGISEVILGHRFTRSLIGEKNFPFSSKSYLTSYN